MEEIAKQLGFTLSLSARSAVMKAPAQERRRKSRSLAACHRDSLSLREFTAGAAASEKMFFKQLVDEDDDQTVSTVNDDDSFSTTAESSFVTFAAPLVTATYERPTTSPDEKKALYYTDAEYRQFKRAYFYRTPDVQIHDNVVTDVWEIPVPEEPSELYYTESDLQG